MINLLYFFKNHNKCEMVLDESRSIGFSVIKSKFMYTSEIIYSFENHKFKECLKHRYDSKDLITLNLQGSTLEDIVNQNDLYNVGFIVGNEIWNIGRFSTPYTVMTSLREYYNTLHNSLMFNNMSTEI